MTSQLKVFRKEIKLTQQEMAVNLEVSLSMYEKVERGYVKAPRGFMDSFKTRYPYIDIKYIFFDN